MNNRLQFTLVAKSTSFKRYRESRSTEHRRTVMGTCLLTKTPRISKPGFHTSLGFLDNNFFKGATLRGFFSFLGQNCAEINLSNFHKLLSIVQCFEI